MKREKTAILVIAAITALALGLMLWQAPGRMPVYNGDRIRGADRYLLDFTALNGEETHTLSLEALLSRANYTFFSKYIRIS